MSISKIVVTSEVRECPQPGESAAVYFASIDGIGAAGTGDTEEEAIRTLCGLLGDFVTGHRGSLDTLRQQLRDLADPPLPLAP